MAGQGSWSKINQNDDNNLKNIYSELQLHDL